MCDLIDYPDGATIDSMHSLAAKYPNVTRGVVFGGSSIHGYLPLSEAKRLLPDQCLCVVHIPTVLTEAGEVWGQTDFGFEVLASDGGGNS